MRPVRDLKNLVHRVRAIPGAAAFRRACRTSLLGSHARIYHYHIRKTAGTSINQSFLSLGGEPGKVVYDRLAEDANHRTISGNRAYVGWSRPLIEQGVYHYAFSHMAAHEVNLPAGTFTITCLRDPLKRLISHYQMLREMIETHTPHPCLKVEGPWVGDSFNDFLDAVPRDHALRQLYMFSREFDPQEATARVRQCGFYFFTEQFTEGMKALSAKLGFELPLMHVRPTGRQYAITDAERARAREMLADEYVMIDALRGS
jgi:hypothetical protein